MVQWPGRCLKERCPSPVAKGQPNESGSEEEEEDRRRRVRKKRRRREWGLGSPLRGSQVAVGVGQDGERGLGGGEASFHVFLVLQWLALKRF